MPKTVTETAVEDQLHIRFRLIDPQQGGSIAERAHAEVLVAYQRTDQPELLGTTVLLKLADSGPTVKGAQLATQAMGHHGELAKNRLTPDERDELLRILMKLDLLGREATGL
jgi:hypothetical protein